MDCLVIIIKRVTFSPSMARICQITYEGDIIFPQEIYL